MIHDRMMRLSAWVALVLALVAALPARPSFAQAENSPLLAARLEPFAYGVAAGDLASDPQSPLKRARNAFEILTGPIGAAAGNPLSTVDIQGLARREADRKILDVWNGDAPNKDGKLQGLKQAGLDPIGLEPDFPGLDTASVSATGTPTGQVVPMDFASFNTYAYVVLTFDKTHLSVTAKGFPIVRDPATLHNTDVLKEYESRKAEEIFHFRVQAQ